MKRTAVWDLPLRMFHWALAGLVVAAVISGKVGGNALNSHVQIGMAILCLLLFRLLWGFVGGTYARFSSFIYSPKTLIAYLRGDIEKPLGHNPLGALSVWALLATLMTLALTGLFSNDDVMVEAPFYPLVSKDTSDWLTWLHTQSRYVIFLLVALHIAAILYYQLWKNEDLVRPMITGQKEAASDSASELDSQSGNSALAAVLFAASALSVWLLVTYLP